MTIEENTVYHVETKLVWVNKYNPQGRSNIRVVHFKGRVYGVHNPFPFELQQLLKGAVIAGETKELEPDLYELFPQYFI